MDPPLPNTYWVLPGSLLAGEYPYGAGAADTQQRLRRLLDAGIDSFIDLTHPGERPDYHPLLPAQVEHWRSAIADAQIPLEIAQMHRILARLQSALAVGRRPYVHCRAGIGRTGLVVGCYLVEQGLDGEAALAQLNRLWQQSARSYSWPRVPQTDAQAAFIRAWPQHRQRDADAPALAALRSLRGRFQGTLRGLALGDALGCSTQFGRPGHFTPVTDLLGGGPYDLPRGAWSDDTALTLGLAESLLATGGVDSADLLARWMRWQRLGEHAAAGQCVGITAATARALAGSGTTASDEAAPLSRVAAAVLFGFADPARALEFAARSAAVTGATPLVQDCARLQAAMLHAALRGEPLAGVMRPAPSAFAGQPLLAPVAALLEADAERPPAGLREPALAALAAARWALGRAGTFREGALIAANFGGDADVIGAIYGQIAAAMTGLAGLPPAWVAAVPHPETLESLADRLLTVALEGLADSSAAIR